MSNALMLDARLRGALETLSHRDRLRQLRAQSGLDFASNDYLGLANSLTLTEAGQAALARGVPVGAGGSRLLRGNHAEHEALEAEAAAFFATEATLFMGGGFQANQALFATLPAAADCVFYDALIHASVHEGLRLSRAQHQPFAHNDVDALRTAIKAWRATGALGQAWIAIESVYSMDGDIAPVADFAALAGECDAVLVVDEAHASGVFGPQGRGFCPHDAPAQIISLHTCGKALGVSGALVCASRAVVDTLVNRARPFIFATAPSPLNAALVRAALRVLVEDPGWRVRFEARLAHTRAEVARLGLGARTDSQIVPVILGSDTRAVTVAAALQARGFDVRAIRPPTVARGTSRLRISITGNVTQSDITALFSALPPLLEQHP